MPRKPKIQSPPAADAAAPPPAVEVITGYKGFNLDWTCRDFQYQVGQSYEHPGKVKVCKTGFHACEYPLDVFGHYEPCSSVYAEVKQSGEISREGGDDTKIASTRITIEAEIKIPDMVSRAIAWILARTTPANTKHADGDQSAASSTGDQSAASSTGYRSAASSTGDQSAASSTGDQSAASSTGDRSAASSTGDQSAASSTGYQSAASSTGDRSAASSTGDQSAASSTGDRSAASSTGDRSAASSTGYQSAASSTGYRSAASSTGDQSAASSTGDRSAASSTGDQSAASSTGYQSAASSTGDRSAAIATGRHGRAMAAAGCALFLLYRDESWNITHTWSGIVGQNGIKPLTWYSLNEKGEPVEVSHGD